MREVTAETSNRIYWAIVFTLIVWLVIYVNQVSDFKDRRIERYKLEDCFRAQFSDDKTVRIDIESSGQKVLGTCKKVLPIGDLRWDSYDSDHFVLVSSEGGSMIGWKQEGSSVDGAELILFQEGFRYR